MAEKLRVTFYTHCHSGGGRRTKGAEILRFSMRYVKFSRCLRNFKYKVAICAVILRSKTSLRTMQVLSEMVIDLMGH